jgi:hypothetical protein
MSNGVTALKHYSVLYDDESDKDEYVVQFLNEGLKSNELCIYGSIRLGDSGYIQRISSKINNYEDNLVKGNLIFVDLSRHYIGALTNNFVHFKKLIADVSNRLSNSNKRVRFIGDCAGFLFQNKHFEQCFALESWLHERSINGIIACPYNKSLLKEYPHIDQIENLNKTHDSKIVISKHADSSEKNR